MFVTSLGTCQFDIMSFGLINTPATFQRILDKIWHHIMLSRAYLADVVFFSKSIDEHLQHLEKIWLLLGKRNVNLKICKLEFSKSSVELLGHIVGSKRISVDPGKVAAVRGGVIPWKATSLRSFLRLCGYCHRLIKKFANLSAANYKGTSKNAAFKWTDRMPEAINSLKLKLKTPPVLVFPNFEILFIFETGASSISVGAVLSQKQKNEKAIWYSTSVENEPFPAKLYNLWRWSVDNGFCADKM